MDTIQLNEQEQTSQPAGRDRLQKVRSFWGIIFSQVGFFWAVLLVFMAVSVTESGAFFNASITHDVADGVLGYAVAATFDLLSLVFMLARLNASRIADRRGEWLSLFGVILCAGVSAFANTTSAVQTYDASQFSHIPAWMSTVAPYLGMAFPLMIIVVSIISDHVGDLNPQRADSIEKYRAKEMKKVQLLKVRLEIERELAAVRRDMADLRSNPSRKQQRTLAAMRAHYDAQIRDLAGEIESLRMLLTPVQEPDTDELETVSQSIPKTVPTATAKTVPHKADTIALQVVRQAVKRDPAIKPAELAKKAQISAGYASKLKTRVLAETLQVATTN
jgi:hypothetical protein